MSTKVENGEEVKMEEVVSYNDEKEKLKMERKTLFSFKIGSVLFMMVTVGIVCYAISDIAYTIQNILN